MKEHARNDELTFEEAARRRDEALRRALNTPPQPQPTHNAKKENPQASKSAPDTPKLAAARSTKG